MKNYVQIGSNEGNDEFFEMCRNASHDSNIFLIEPNPDLLPTLKTKYDTLINKNINILNIGIVGENTKNVNTLYLYGDENCERIGHGLSSVLKRKSYNKIMKTISFQPKTFNDFCAENNIKDIEILFIDTEGLDYEILKSIDIDSINIKKIYFEYWPYTNDDEENKVNTGDSELYKVFEKYRNYSKTEIRLGGMKSYLMEKI